LLYIFLKVGGVEALQRFVPILSAVDGEAIVCQPDAGEALAELGVHILLEGATGQLRPGGYVLEVFEHLRTGGGGVGVGHAADYGGQAVEL